MTTYYKLTDMDMRTYGRTQWELGVPRRAAEGELKQCTKTALHGYTSPLLAVLLNPIHANLSEFRLFECEFTGEVECDGLKVWGREQTLIREIPAPVFTARQLILFAIRAERIGLKRGAIPAWDAWADAYEARTDTPEMVDAAQAKWASAQVAARVVRPAAKSKNFDGFAFAAKLHEIAEAALMS